jgi:hypothetical protein
MKSLNCSHRQPIVHNQVINEHGESWWNDAAGKTDSSSRVFWQSYQHIYLVAKQEELAKKIMN